MNLFMHVSLVVIVRLYDLLRNPFFSVRLIYAQVVNVICVKGGVLSSVQNHDMQRSGGDHSDYFIMRNQFICFGVLYQLFIVVKGKE